MEKIKFEIGFGVGLVGCNVRDEVEVDLEEVQGMTDEEMEEYVWKEHGEQIIWDTIDAWVKRVED